MPTAQLPLSERVMLSIDRLVTARIKLEREETQTPSYPMQIKAAQDAVKSAQYSLLMQLDDLKAK
jgi:hypothetical protein